MCLYACVIMDCNKLITLVAANDDKTNDGLIPNWKEKSRFSHSTINLCLIKVIRHAEKV